MIKYVLTNLWFTLFQCWLFEMYIWYKQVNENV